jgi:hypothetical protein
VETDVVQQGLDARVVFVDFGFDLEGVCALERPATAAAAAKKALTAPRPPMAARGPWNSTSRHRGGQRVVEEELPYSCRLAAPLKHELQ